MAGIKKVKAKTLGLLLENAALFNRKSVSFQLTDEQINLVLKDKKIATIAQRDLIAQLKKSNKTLALSNEQIAYINTIFNESSKKSFYEQKISALRSKKWAMIATPAFDTGTVFFGIWWTLIDVLEMSALLMSISAAVATVGALFIAGGAGFLYYQLAKRQQISLKAKAAHSLLEYEISYRKQQSAEVNFDLALSRVIPHLSFLYKNAHRDNKALCLQFTVRLSAIMNLSIADKKVKAILDIIEDLYQEKIIQKHQYRQFKSYLQTPSADPYIKVQAETKSWWQKFKGKARSAFKKYAPPILYGLGMFGGIVSTFAGLTTMKIFGLGALIAGAAAVTTSGLAVTFLALGVAGFIAYKVYKHQKQVQEIKHSIRQVKLSSKLQDEKMAKLSSYSVNLTRLEASLGSHILENYPQQMPLSSTVKATPKAESPIKKVVETVMTQLPQELTTESQDAQTSQRFLH